MTFKDFKYIDIALGGAMKRNNVISLEYEFNISKTQHNCYTTMFRFKKEFKQLVKSTGSVRGCNEMSCWSDYLWFDIDSEDLNVSYKHALSLVEGFKSMGLDNDDIKIFFSGSKGFHIGINSFKFGFEPSVHLPEQMRFTAHKIADLFQVDIDRKIYNHSRLWRIPDTVHAKTKLLKTELTYNEFKKSIDVIIKLSSSTKKRFPNYVLGEKCNSIKALVKITKQIEKKVQKTDSWERPVQSEKTNRIVKEALEYLLQTPVEKGSRDNETLLRASECRKVGIDKDECHDLVSAWNKTNKHPISEDDVDRIVDSAYTGKGYDFGTKNESLKEARAAAKKQIEDDEPTTSTSPEDKFVEDFDYDSLPEFIKIHIFNDKSFKQSKKPEDGKPEDKIIDRSLNWSDISNDPSLLESPKSLTMFNTCYRGLSTLFWSLGKQGKGTTMATEILNVIENTNLRVLILNSDEPMLDLKRRLKQIGGTGISDSRSIGRFKILPKPRNFREVAIEIHRFKPDIVYADSLTALFQTLSEFDGGPESQDDNDYARMMNYWKYIAEEFDIAVCVIHHSTKDGKKPRQSAVIVNLTSIQIQLETHKKKSTSTFSYDGRYIIEDIEVKYIHPYLYEIQEPSEMNSMDEEDDTTLSQLEYNLLMTLLANPSVSRSLLRKYLHVSPGTMTTLKKNFDIQTENSSGNDSTIWSLLSKQVEEYTELTKKQNKNIRNSYKPMKVEK